MDNIQSVLDAVKNRRKKKWTQNMRRGLRFICQFIVDNHKSPTYNEIQIALGYCDRMLVKRLISDLKEHGYIDRWPGKHRGISIVDPSNLPSDLFHDPPKRKRKVKHGGTDNGAG